MLRRGGLLSTVSPANYRGWVLKENSIADLSHPKQKLNKQLSGRSSAMRSRHQTQCETLILFQTGAGGFCLKRRCGAEMDIGGRSGKNSC